MIELKYLEEVSESYTIHDPNTWAEMNVRVTEGKNGIYYAIDVMRGRLSAPGLLQAAELLTALSKKIPQEAMMPCNIKTVKKFNKRKKINE